MKKLLVAFFFVASLGASAQAADIYYSPTGGGSGASCISPKTAPPASGDYIAGNTLHFCAGTYTGTPGVTYIVVQGSGSLGLPITLHGEPGSILTNTWWPVTGGAISCNSQPFIVIDNMTVRATGNGTLLANQQDTRGIDCQQSTANTVIIQNSIVTNLYIRQEDSTTDGHESIAVSLGGSHTKALHNSIDHARVGIGFGYCGQTDLEIGFNAVTFSNHHITVGGNNVGCTLSTVRIHDNDFGGGAYLWDWPCPCPPGNAFHHNAIHSFASGGHATVTDMMVWNNYVHGSWGNDTAYLASSGGTHITGAFFFETIGPGIRVFNNIFAMSNPSNERLTVPDNGYIVYKGGTGDPLEESRAAVTVNNTFVRYVVAGNVGDITTSVPGGHVWENNVTQGTGYHVFTATGNTAMATSDYNNWFNVPANTWGGSPINQTLASWQAGVGPGTESHSTFTNPNLNATTFIPGAGSPVIGAGLNLTFLGISQLNFDKNGAPRPSSGGWDVGALNFSGATACLNITVNPTNYGSVTVGLGSTPQLLTITSCGSIPAVLGTPIVSGKGGTNPTMFTDIVGGTCIPGQTLTTPNSCTLNSQFTPTSAGAKNATFSVGSNTSASVVLNGIGVAVTSCILTVTPTTKNYGNIQQFLASPDQTFTIKNSGTVPCTLQNPVTTFGGPFPLDWAITGGVLGECTLAQVLAPNATCTKAVHGTPSTLTTENGTVTFSTSTAGGTNASATLQMTGVPPALTLTINPRPIALPDTIINTPSATRTATVKNTGTATITLNAGGYLTITGALAGHFHDLGTGTCGNGVPLVVNGTCTIDFSGTPVTAVLEQATVIINSNATVAPSDTIQVQGLNTPTNPAPTTWIIALAIDLFPRQITISGGGFVVGKTQITIDGIAQPTVCSSTSICVATLPASTVLLPGFGVIGHVIGVK